MRQPARRDPHPRSQFRTADRARRHEVGQQPQRVIDRRVARRNVVSGSGGCQVRDQLVDYGGQRSSTGESKHWGNSPPGVDRAHVRGTSWRGPWVEERHRALLGSDLDPMWCVGGHDHLRASVSRAVLIEHRQRRCGGHDLHGVVGMHIGGADGSGEGQHPGTQQRRPTPARFGGEITARPIHRHKTMIASAIDR